MGNIKEAMPTQERESVHIKFLLEVYEFNRDIFGSLSARDRNITLIYFGAGTANYRNLGRVYILSHMQIGNIVKRSMQTLYANSPYSIKSMFDQDELFRSKDPIDRIPSKEVLENRRAAAERRRRNPTPTETSKKRHRRDGQLERFERLEEREKLSQAMKKVRERYPTWRKADREE